jgi:hypothetical protein
MPFYQKPYVDQLNSYLTGIGYTLHRAWTQEEFEAIYGQGKVPPPPAGQAPPVPQPPPFQPITSTQRRR